MNRRKTRFGRQGGQALPLGLGMVMAIALGGLALFNTGQVVSEKSRLVNTADAAVYSGLIWQARALNFQAYTNRAMVANQVSIAQLVSLASWASYHKVTSRRLNAYLGWIPPVRPFVEAYKNVASKIEQVTENLVEGVIPVIDSVNGVLAAAQRVMFAASFVATPAIVKAVVERNDPRYQVESAFNIASLAGNVRDWQRFTKRRSIDDEDGGESMLRKTKLIRASRDDFTRRRYWKEPGRKIPSFPYSSWFLISFNRRANIVKDGETRLIYKPDNDGNKWEWKAKDTIAVHHEKLKIKNFSLKWRRHRELPVGWGETRLGKEIECNEPGQTVNLFAGLSFTIGGGCPRWARNEKRQNPRTERIADRNAEDLKASYSGVRAYYDLRDLSRQNRDPRLLLRVQVDAPKNRIRTSSQVGGLGSPGSVSRGQGNTGGNGIEAGMFNPGEDPPGGSVSSVAKGEVFFKRPVGPNGENRLRIRNRNRTEYASLYNPYWDVRLVELPETERAGAWALKAPELIQASASAVPRGAQRYVGRTTREIGFYTQTAADAAQGAVDEANEQVAQTQQQIGQAQAAAQQQIDQAQQLGQYAQQQIGQAGTLAQQRIDAARQRANALSESLQTRLSQADPSSLVGAQLGSYEEYVRLGLSGGEVRELVSDTAKDTIRSGVKDAIQNALQQY